MVVISFTCFTNINLQVYVSGQIIILHHSRFPRFPWNRGISLSYLLGWGRVFGHYNLTRCMYTLNTPPPKCWLKFFTSDTSTTQIWPKQLEKMQKPEESRYVLIWHPKMVDPWKSRFLLDTIIFRVQSLYIYIYISLRIEICPKKVISPINLFWGWDVSTINPTNFGRGLDS